MIRILVVSDTHGLHGGLGSLPRADIFIHAGDFMNKGTSYEEISNFNSWLGTIPANHKLVCAGNHDRLFENNYSVRKTLHNCRYFENEAVKILGIRFYFSPYTPEFCNWAFNMTREQLKNNWTKIPDDTEFLVTHGPPYGILDQAHPGSSCTSDILASPGEHLGDIELLHRVKQLKKLKYHVFGHIHGSRGISPSVWGPTFVNASFLNEQYRPHSGPGYTILEVE